MIVQFNIPTDCFLSYFYSFFPFVLFRMLTGRIMPAFQASFLGITPGYAGKYHGLIWGTVRVFMGMPRVSMGKTRVTMGNSTGLNSCFIAVDNTLISLVG